MLCINGRVTAKEQETYILPISGGMGGRLLLSIVNEEIGTEQFIRAFSLYIYILKFLRH